MTTCGNILNLLMVSLGVWNMEIDDLSPYRIWFTVPGVCIIGFSAGFLGDGAVAIGKRWLAKMKCHKWNWI